MTGLFVLCCFDMYPVGMGYDCLFHRIWLQARLEIHLINVGLIPDVGIVKDDDAEVEMCSNAFHRPELGVFEASHVYSVIY